MATYLRRSRPPTWLRCAAAWQQVSARASAWRRTAARGMTGGSERGACGARVLGCWPWGWPRAHGSIAKGLRTAAPRRPRVAGCSRRPPEHICYICYNACKGTVVFARQHATAANEHTSARQKGRQAWPQKAPAGRARTSAPARRSRARMDVGRQKKVGAGGGGCVPR